MSENKSYDPLKKCMRVYSRSKSIALISTLYPLPVLFLVLWWFTEQFSDRLGDYLILLILGLFIFSQLVTQVQWLIHWHRAKQAKKILKVLDKNKSDFNIAQVESELIANKSKSSIKELLLTWFHLARLGETENMEAALNNNTGRQELKSQKEISIHIYINRITLKLGFIGTLYGLVLTFDPMKRAILALNELEGEMAFIKDIASAIDGDHYAIFSTLIATGLSLFIELLNVQLLERMANRYEIARSHLMDWNMVSLQPHISGQNAMYDHEAKFLEKEEELQERRERLLDDKDRLLDKTALQNQKLTNQLKDLGVALERSETQLDDLAEVQDSIGRRVGELKHVEKQYKSFQHLQRVKGKSTNIDNGEDSGDNKGISIK